MPAVPHTADMLGILHTVEMRDAKSKCRKKVFQTGAAIARRTHGNVHKKKKPGTAAGLLTNIFFDQFISLVLRSGAQAAKLFGSHCSCE
jgi:hypothetical protein